MARTRGTDMRLSIARLLGAYSAKLMGVERIIPEIGSDDRALLDATRGLTMTALVARWELIQAVRYVEANAIAGDIVECGVWRGGNLVLAGLMRKRMGFSRQIWGFDTFAGMTSPTDADFKPGEDVDVRRKFQSLDRGSHNAWCYAPEDQVLAEFEKRTGSRELKLVKGPVEETLGNPANLPERIAILLLDTDFYESTRAELEMLYPRLSPGGVLIVDDYGEWAGARRAVDEYFDGRPIWLHYVTPTVRLAVKPTN